MADVPRDLASPFDAAMAEQARASVAMAGAALREGRLRLAFQPVVIGANPSRIGFHEALIRVLDESGRVIPAGEFMPAVEPTEMGRQIDCAALDLGLRTLRDQPGLRIAVNMSARSIGYPRWTKILRQAVAGHPDLGHRLILEITEGSAMLVPELVMAFMDEMQPLGITFALDDFGAGATSLRYFRDLFFDILKIDGQFIRGVARDPDNQALTRAMLSIGRHFDMLTVAESVETAEDAAFLQGEGIGAMQGFLFGAATVNPPWAQAQAQGRRRA